MAIRVEIEKLKSAPREWEACCFCSKPTPYWSLKKDVPVCPICAVRRDEAEVPAKLDWALGGACEGSVESPWVS